MEKVKAYTDLEQSKKLAEILPIESADMEYILEHWIDEKTGRHKEGYYEIPVIKVDDDSPLQQITHPCWSLAALFNVLPEYIKFDGHTWKFYNDHYGVYYMNADTYDTNTFSTSSENLVDACYEMIIKLHEEKLL